ncbi:hypothetical protein JK628_02800 [Shewanella sp. KX20019]|uniref:hypothetical protein n=1 Tax=Shewanella sp. KX20019 TaxID=2803864 RepID=UPI001926A60E|nr:hypothetical protein [Shewanella sp. KX20019]QQX80818.1 hypothetical protein JK628_02800 [Shewanella sp. KX20019]
MKNIFKVMVVISFLFLTGCSSLPSNKQIEEMELSLIMQSTCSFDNTVRDIKYALDDSSGSVFIGLGMENKVRERVYQERKEASFVFYQDNPLYGKIMMYGFSVKGETVKFIARNDYMIDAYIDKLDDNFECFSANNK